MDVSSKDDAMATLFAYLDFEDERGCTGGNGIASLEWYSSPQPDIWDEPFAVLNPGETLTVWIHNNTHMECCSGWIRITLPGECYFGGCSKHEECTCIEDPKCGHVKDETTYEQAYEAYTYRQAKSRQVK